MLPPSTDLMYFYEVATESSISRAAIKLNVSQPSLSLGIQRLEKIIQTSLFVRHKQGVTLTRAGKELFKNVSALFTQWDEILSQVKQANQEIKGSVVIGCHSALTPHMSNMVAMFLKQYPSLEIHFQHGLTSDLAENIIHGHIDIGILTDPPSSPDLIILPVAETEFTFWMSAKHDAIDLYAEETVIICDTRLAPTQYLIKELRQLKRGNRLRLTTMNQIEAIAAMVAESDGAGILPASFVEFSFIGSFKGKLKRVINAPTYKKPLCLAYRTENKNVMAVTIVLNGIKKLVKEILNNEK